jgi:hypothetical protein
MIRETYKLHKQVDAVNGGDDFINNSLISVSIDFQNTDE